MTDAILHDTGWRARLSARLFARDAVPLTGPPVAVAADSVPR